MVIYCRSPQINRTTLITTHPKSAFVSLCTNVQSSTVCDSGKIIKQYYNRKRNSLLAAKQPCTITSSSKSPLLGFEAQNETNRLNIINDFIKTLSQYVNGFCGQQQQTTKVVLNETSDNKNERFNGFKAKNELNIQEQLDLEFARRLHEELNNPRQTRASQVNNKKSPIKTRSSPRKRQVTLEELITPKKFKL